MDTNIYDFQIRVLLYRDEPEWVAHALEMDLVACGKTERDALRELRNLVFNQISFAMGRNPGLGFAGLPESRLAGSAAVA